MTGVLKARFGRDSINLPDGWIRANGTVVKAKAFTEKRR
ncbi:hypothetical protein THTE_4502 [Thermogutta terrifontis]|uniref:Uncharacterized protein n=1 Tax=Thermogutta terrifontis TaxID=1331910 RepID=A0A286RM99_9BACT|nr:hypothetical protein THTE_4502 [Thermogutta terrifontis]